MGGRVTVTAGLCTLSELRARATLALAPVSDTDPAVLDAPVEAVDPPALIVAWSDPWVEFETPCFWYANLAVLAVASRVDPGAGIEELEQLVGYTLGRFRDDSYPWPQVAAQAPHLFEIANIPLFGARLVFRAPVTI